MAAAAFRGGSALDHQNGSLIRGDAAGRRFRATKRSSGPARRVIDALAANRNHVIALSPFILGEVGRVLSYPRMQALYRLTGDEIHDHTFGFPNPFPGS